MSSLSYGEVSCLFRGVTEFKVKQAHSVPHDDLGQLAAGGSIKLSMCLSFLGGFQGSGISVLPLVPTIIQEENRVGGQSGLERSCEALRLPAIPTSSTQGFVTNICFQHRSERNASALWSMMGKP